MFRFVFVHLVYFLSFCSGLVFVCLLGYLVSFLLRLSFFLFAFCIVFLLYFVSVLDFVFMIKMGSKGNSDRNSACRSDARSHRNSR